MYHGKVQIFLAGMLREPLRARHVPTKYRPGGRVQSTPRLSGVFKQCHRAHYSDNPPTPFPGL